MAVTEGARSHAADVRAARFVWDPAVHHHFRESCSYFLIRLTTPDVPGVERVLIKHLQRASVKAYCTYVIYGFHDALVRAWMTQQKRESFLNSITDDIEIDGVEEFRVDVIDFLWSNVSNLGRRSLERHLSEVADTAEFLQAEIGSGKAAPADAMDQLLRSDLLHLLPGLSEERFPDPVKVYIALTRIYPGKAIPGERERLLDITASGFTNFENVSVYQGIGFAHYLIKGVVPRYRDVLPTLTILTERLAPLGLRSATYLVADSNAYESDYIDIGWEDLDLSLSRLSNLIGGDVDRRLALLSKVERQAVTRIFDTYSPHLLATPFEPYFINLLRHRIGDAEVVLGETLSFLVRLELYVRELSIRLWATGLGNKQWRAHVIELANERKIDTGGRGPEHGSLKAILRIMAALVDAGDISKDAAERFLGDTWRQTLANNRVTDLRNEVAHGDFFLPAREEQFLRNWDENVREVLEIGRGYVAVADSYSRFIRHGAELP